MPFTIPEDLSTRLRAVNVLLGAIGEAPVSSIETSQAVDVAEADATLTEVDNAVQSEGWHFNTEEEMRLAPDEDDEIVLPSNTLSVSRARWVSSGTFKFGQRGGRLYNRTDHTLSFEEPVYVDLVVKLDWEDLPEYARRYITIRAAMQFQGRVQNSGTVTRITQEEVTRALTVMEQNEDRGAQLNRLTGNPEALNRLHGRARRR